MATTTGQADGLRIILGCVPDQATTVRTTLPCLMSAAVYADELVVISRETDIFMELPDWFEISGAFEGFMEYVGAGDNLGLTGEDPAEVARLAPASDWLMTRRDDEPVQALLHIASERSPVRSEVLRAGVPNELVDLVHEYLHLDRSPEAALAYERDEALAVAQGVEMYLNNPSSLPMVYDPNGLLSDEATSLSTLFQPTKITKEAHARTGSGLVDRMPSFDTLSPEQVIEVRRHLGEYLTPFRAFVAETSHALESYVRDEDATADVLNELYVGKVRPTLSALDSEWRQASSTRLLLREFGRDPQAFTQSFLTFAAGSLASLPLEASLGAAAASQVIGAESKSRAIRRDLKKSHLYFLHALEQRFLG